MAGTKGEVCVTRHYELGTEACESKVLVLSGEKQIAPYTLHYSENCMFSSMIGVLLGGQTSHCFVKLYVLCTSDQACST